MGTVSPCLLTNMAHLLLFLGLLAGIFAQDTHYCPDGWSVSDIDGEIECILLSGLQERVTKADAEAICASHDGWLVDMDEGTGPQKNNFLKQLVSQADGREPCVTGSTGATTGATGSGTTQGQILLGMTG